MKEATSSRLTSSYFGGNSTNLGAFGGSESHLLTTAQIPSHIHANTLNDPGHSHGHNANAGSSTTGGGGFSCGGNSGATISAATTGISLSNASAGGGGAHNNVQPTIVCNYIIRII
jgi:microcystin-dependent protein